MKQKPYPTYKPSGVGWLGDVPEHWEVRKLKYFFRLLTTKTENHANPIALENIESWTGRLIATETEFDGEGIAFLKDDILFGKLRPYLAKVLKADRSGEAVGDFFVMRPQLIMKPEYASFFLRSEDFINIIDGATFGSKMPRTSWEFMGAVRIPLPTPREQQAIATFLDREMGRIDALVAKKKRLIELLREKRAALISHTVTKGLDPSVKLKPSGVEWLSDVPEHWEVKRLKHIGLIRYGLGEPPEYVDEGLSFIRATDIKQGKIDMDLVKKVSPDDVPWRRRPQLKLNEILVVRSGAYTGDSALVTPDVVDCIAGYDMVFTVSNAYSPFVAWVILSKYMLYGQIYLERLRAAQPHLNAEELGRFFILLPPFPEQQAIAAFLDQETGKIDALIAKIEAAITKLKEYRTALISAAVTGKIDVREVA